MQSVLPNKTTKLNLQFAIVHIYEAPLDNFM